MGIELIFQFLNNPILKFIKIYFQAIIIFIITIETGRALFSLFIFDTIFHILDMMVNYPLYISFFEIMIQSFKFGNAWDLYLFAIIWIPFCKITALYGARSTIRRLKILNRLGIR